MDTIVTEGKWVFTLERDEEKTTRSITIVNPVTTEESVQTKVNTVNAKLADTTARYNKIIQPSNWRDDNAEENEWTATKAEYFIIRTQTTPYEYEPEPDPEPDPEPTP